ncbi:MAG: tRNA 4-thiouridine(8) synthase ThiI [Desulfobacteraceae bacterium]
MILKDQGIDVEWVCFETPFFSSRAAVKGSDVTGIPIIVEDITDVFMTMLESPKAGYGKHMNPCMDCHALMFSRAGRIMEQRRFDFLFSGEVAGQRPKSQTRNAMGYVAKQSGFDRFILRPLSAGILPESHVEQQGLVDRSRLSALSGRSRKGQLQMAKKFGLKEFPAPSGGCLLTDKGFSSRLRDLVFVQKKYEKRELYLLKHGRHIRLDEQTKVVVGRSEPDNDHILAQYDKTRDVLLEPVNIPGPVMLVPGGADETAVKQAASICAGYTKTRPGGSAEIEIKNNEGCDRIIVPAADPADIKSFIIL